MPNNKICELECAFEKSKYNLSFDTHDKVGYIRLVADGSQMAEVAKLLLLAGSNKTFRVVFYEKNSKESKKSEYRESSRKSSPFVG